MKKIFIMTGELSGDRLAAWYVRKLRVTMPEVSIHAVGGDFLQQEGVTIVERFEAYNVVGVLEIIKRLPHILRSIKRLVTYILEQEFDEVILVDFPGFNLRLAHQLVTASKRVGTLGKPTITYLSPPQLWCWGAWRVRSLKAYCNRVIVMYPFEVAWYAKRGVVAEWLGNPAYDQLLPYSNPSISPEPCIALMPGSRRSEIDRLLPLMLQAAALIRQRYPTVRFVLAVARSVSADALEAQVKRHNLQALWASVQVVREEAEKYQALAQCAVAISKPGTVTLELALLRVPTIVAFKISWVTYFLARPLVRVPFMALPNLLLRKTVFPEIIQYGCTAERIAHETMTWYARALRGDQTYVASKQACDQVIGMLAGHK